MSNIGKLLTALILAFFAVGSGTVLADRDDDHDGNSEHDRGGGREALSLDLRPVSKDFAGRGYGQYMEIGSDGVETAFNANVRLALVSPAGKVLNEAIGITEDNAETAVVKLYLGRDLDGDGTCQDDGPYAICWMKFGEIEVNPIGIVHATYKLALRVEDGMVKGDGHCVGIQILEGEDILPDIIEDDSTGVGVLAEEAIGEVVPVLFGIWDD